MRSLLILASLALGLGQSTDTDCPSTDVKLYPHELDVSLLSANASTGFQFSASIPIWVETTDGNDVSFEAEASVMATIDGKPFQAFRAVEYYIVPKVSQISLDREAPEGTKPMPRTFFNFTFSFPPGCNLDDVFTVAVRVDRGNSVAESDESNNAFWTTVTVSSLVPTVVSVIPDLKGKFIYNVNIPNKLFVTTDAPLLPGMRLEYSVKEFKTDNTLPPDGFTTVPTRVYKLGTGTFYEYTLDLSMGLFSAPTTSAKTGNEDVFVWVSLPVAVYKSVSEATKGTATGIVDINAASSSNVYSSPAITYSMVNGAMVATAGAMTNRTNIAKLQVRKLSFEMIVSNDVLKLVNIATGASMFSADGSGNAVVEAAASVGRLRDPLIPSGLWSRSSLNPMVRPSFYKLWASIKPNATGISVPLDAAFDQDSWFAGDYGAAIDWNIKWSFDSSSGKLIDSVEAYFWLYLRGSVALKFPVTKMAGTDADLPASPKVWPFKAWDLSGGVGLAVDPTADTGFVSIQFQKTDTTTIPMSRNVLLSNGLVVPLAYDLLLKPVSISLVLYHLPTTCCDEGSKINFADADTYITVYPGLFYLKKASTQTTDVMLTFDGAARISGLPEAGGVMAAVDAFSSLANLDVASNPPVEKLELSMPFSPSKPFVEKVTLNYDFVRQLFSGVNNGKPLAYSEISMSIQLPDSYKPQGGGAAGSYFVSGSDGKQKTYAYTVPSDAGTTFSMDPASVLSRWAMKEFMHTDSAASPLVPVGAFAPSAMVTKDTEYFAFDSTNLGSKLVTASSAKFPLYSYGGGSGTLLRNTFERYPGLVAMALDGRALTTTNPRLVYMFGVLEGSNENTNADAHYIQPLPKAAVPGKPDVSGIGNTADYIKFVRSWMADVGAPSVAWLPTTNVAASMADASNFGFEWEKLMAVASHDKKLAGLHSITAVTRILRFTASDKGWDEKTAADNVFSSSYLSGADVVISHGITAVSSGTEASLSEVISSGITAVRPSANSDKGVGVVISNTPQLVASASTATAGDLPDTCPIAGATTTGTPEYQFKPNGFDGFPSVSAAPLGSGLIDVLVNVVNDDEYANEADAGHVLPMPADNARTEFFRATSTNLALPIKETANDADPTPVDATTDGLYDIGPAIKRMDGRIWRWTPVGPDPKNPLARIDKTTLSNSKKIEIEEEIMNSASTPAVVTDPSSDFTGVNPNQVKVSPFICTIDFKTRIIIPFKGGMVKLSRASTVKLGWSVPPSHYRIEYLIADGGSPTTETWDRFDDNSFQHKRTFDSFRNLAAISVNGATAKRYCPNDNVATTTYPAIKARNDTFVPTVKDGDNYKIVKGIVIIIESGYPGTGSNPLQGRLNQRVALDAVWVQHTAILPNFIGSLLYVKDADSRIVGKNPWSDQTIMHSTFTPSLDANMMTSIPKRRWSTPSALSLQFSVPNGATVTLNAAERIQSHTALTNPTNIPTGSAVTFALLTSAIPAAADSLGSHVLQVFGMAYFHATRTWSSPILLSTQDATMMTSTSCRAAVMQPAMASDYDSSLNLPANGLVYHVGFICDKPSKTMSSSQVGYVMVVVDPATSTVVAVPSSFTLFDEKYCAGASTLTLAKTDFGLSAVWVIGRALVVSEIRLPLKPANGLPRSAVVLSGSDWTVPTRAALPLTAAMTPTDAQTAVDVGRIPAIYASQAMKTTPDDSFAPVTPYRALTVRFPLANPGTDNKGDSQWRVAFLKPRLKIVDIGFVGLAPQMTSSTTDATSDLSSATSGVGMIQVLVQVNNTGFIRSTGGKLLLQTKKTDGTVGELAAINLPDIPANTAQTIVVPVRTADIVDKEATYIYATISTTAGTATVDNTKQILPYTQALITVDDGKKTSANPCMLSLGGLSAHPLTGIGATLTHLGACAAKVVLEIDYERGMPFTQTTATATDIKYVEVHVPPGSSGAVAFDEDLSAATKALAANFVNEGTGTATTSSRGLLVRIWNRDARDMALLNENSDTGTDSADDARWYASATMSTNLAKRNKKAHFGPNDVAPTALVIPFIPRQLYVPAEGVRVTHNYDLADPTRRYTVVAITVIQMGIAPIARSTVKDAIGIKVERLDETAGAEVIATTKSVLDTANPAICYDVAGRMIDKDFTSSRTTSKVLQNSLTMQYPGMRCVYRFKVTSTATDFFSKPENMYRVTATIDSSALSNLEWPASSSKDTNIPAISVSTEAVSMMVGMPTPTLAFKGDPVTPDDSATA